MIGAPLMTALGTKVSRKHMLMLLMGLFILGNLLSALAPTFGLMLTGRIVASLAHGAFFGIGAVVAADLVAPEKKAGAIAMMFTGLTVANVVGVPLGTLLGQAVGWRLTFLAVAALGVVGLPRRRQAGPRHAQAGRRAPAPRTGRLPQRPGPARHGDDRARLRWRLRGHHLHRADDDRGHRLRRRLSITWLLVLFGLGMVVGNLIGGKFADRALMPMLYISLGALAVVLALFTVTAHNKAAAAVTIVLIGALGFATVPPLQKRVLDQAAGAPTLASAVNIGAFNLGNALAAWLGGLVIAAGLGYTSPNWVGAALAASAIVIAVISAALERRDAARGTVVAGAAPTAADRRSHWSHG